MGFLSVGLGFFTVEGCSTLLLWLLDFWGVGTGLVARTGPSLGA